MNFMFCKSKSFSYNTYLRYLAVILIENWGDLNQHTIYVQHFSGISFHLTVCRVLIVYVTNFWHVYSLGMNSRTIHASICPEPPFVKCHLYQIYIYIYI